MGAGRILARIRKFQKNQHEKCSQAERNRLFGAMAQFVEVPLQRLQADALQALLEEFASRDGTDYGECEVSLQQKVSELSGQLQRKELILLYDADSEQWDLLPRDQALQLLDD
jgi:uncharacterized protein